jgi:hypothetical protein
LNTSSSSTDFIYLYSFQPNTPHADDHASRTRLFLPGLTNTSTPHEHVFWRSSALFLTNTNTSHGHDYFSPSHEHEHESRTRLFLPASRARARFTDTIISPRLTSTSTSHGHDYFSSPYEHEHESRTRLCPPSRLSANLLSEPSFSAGPVNSLLDAFRADSVSRPGIVEGKFLSNLTMTFQTDNFHGSISSLSRTADHRSWTAFKNKCLLTLFSKTANIYLF